MEGLKFKNKPYYILIFLILYILTINQNIFSQELQREYRSALFLGRGDTGIAIAQGVDAIFYNPAGIAQGKGILSEVVLASPQVEGSKNLEQLYNSYNGGNKSALQILAENQNTVFSGAVQNYSGLIFRKVALGVLDRANANAYQGIDPVTGIPTANIYAANRLGVYLTLAQDFFNQHLFIGMNGKLIRKKEVDLKISALDAESQLSNNSLSTVINNSIKEGSGFGGDLGMMLVLHKETKTHIGIVYRNLGMEYKWPIPEGSTAPSSEPSVLDIGFSTSTGTKKSRVIFLIDYRDATNSQNAVPEKRVHLGIEYSLMDLVGITCGINQGYSTFGAYFHTRIIKIEGGMYTEEIGEKPGNLPSNRYFVRMELGWLI